VTYGEPVNSYPRTGSRVSARSARTAAAATTIALVASLVAVGPATSVPIEADGSTLQVRADAPAGLETYYGQVLTWTTCASNLTCAWLTVPLDYANPTGATIRLRVSKATATGPAESRQGSLVVNPGGPGASGLDFAAYVAQGLAPDVAREFDIVGFDTRGVGRSAPITCMTGAQTTRFLRADPTPDGRAEERRLMSQGARLADGCLRMSPAIARHVGSEDTARDLDVLRQALGDDRLNWLGFSYGTYLGTLYAEQFPDRVGRFVLDGALDPSLDIMEVSRGQSSGFQVAMKRFASDCSRRSTCPYPGSANRVLKGINQLLASIETSPLPTGSGRRLVQAEALGAMFYSMYSPSIWSTLRRALQQAKQGNGLGLQSIFDYANERTGPNSYATNMASAFPAIACWDAPPAPGQAGLRSAAAAWSRNARVPEMARAMAWGNAVCSRWYGHATREPAPAATTTTAPILVVGTRYDPATPYPWAVALAEQLPTATLLSYVGDGHTAYGAGSRCVDRAIDTFLLTGTPPPGGSVCR
jgi:pimeloyl-ACP methyl ester carboxylesterase